MNKPKIVDPTFPTDVLKRSQKIFGREYQMGIAVEELSELQKELLKNTNRKKDNIPEIIDETADVYISLCHIIVSYNIQDAVQARVMDKIKRLDERLKIRESASSLEEYTRMCEQAKAKQNQKTK